MHPDSDIFRKSEKAGYFSTFGDVTLLLEKYKEDPKASKGFSEVGDFSEFVDFAQETQRGS